MTCPSCGSNLRDDARICLSCGEMVRAKVAPAERMQTAPAGVPSWIALDAQANGRPVSYPASRLQRIVAAGVDAVVIAIPLVLLGLASGQSVAAVDESHGSRHCRPWIEEVLQGHLVVCGEDAVLAASGHPACAEQQL